MNKERDFVEIAIRSLADKAELSENLLNIFSRILSRQLTIDEESNQIEYGAAFDSLLSIFTFVASDPDHRPGSPFGYEDRVEQAKEDAKAEVLGPIDDSPINIIQPQEDTIDPTWTGTSDERDIFVVPIDSDENGAFATFGDAVIENYQQDEGDAILFVDQNNEWNSLDDFVAEVHPENGHAKILFNNDPLVEDPDQSHSLQIEGAMTALPFANTPSDITNANMHVTTEQEVDAAGGIDSYIDLWLA